MEEIDNTYVLGDIDRFIEQLEQGMFEQEWIKERLRVIKSNEKHKVGKSSRLIILDASES